MHSRRRGTPPSTHQQREHERGDGPSGGGGIGGGKFRGVTAALFGPRGSGPAARGVAVRGMAAMGAAVGLLVIVILAFGGSREPHAQSFDRASALVTPTRIGPCNVRLVDVLRLETPPPAVDLSECLLGVGDRLMNTRDALFAMPLEWRSHVRQLDLGGNQLKGIGFTFFFWLGVAQPLFPSLTILFLSGNTLEAVPPVLRRLHLTRLSLKDNLLTAVDGSALPSGLVHLILTGNRIRRASSFHTLTRLRKLMLSGNELTSACGFVTRSGVVDPRAASIGYHGPKMPSLELLRLARNNISSLEPGAVACFAAASGAGGGGGAFPSLRWLSLAGNPIAASAARRAEAPPLPDVSAALECAPDALVLGSGASGVVKRCTLAIAADDVPILQQQQQEGTGEVALPVRRREAATSRRVPVAVKFFKRISSDGSATDEMEILRLVPRDAALVRPIGRVPAVGAASAAVIAPNGAAVYPLMDHPSPLGLPPTIDTVTQDRFAPDSLRWNVDVATTVAIEVARAMRRLHAAGVAHGDLYAHNVFLSAIRTQSPDDAAAAQVQHQQLDAAVAAALATVDAFLANISGGGGADVAVPRVSDFGASFEYRHADIAVDASPQLASWAALEADKSAWPRAVEAMEVRSYAVFLDDLLQHHVRTPAAVQEPQARALQALVRDCGGPLASAAAAAAGSGGNGEGGGGALQLLIVPAAPSSPQQTVFTFANVVARLEAAPRTAASAVL